MDKIRSPLPPLLTVAAISLTVFSAIGVAALTGLIPPSKSHGIEIPKEVAKPIESVITHPVAKPAARKPAARSAAPRKTEPVVFDEFEAPRIARDPQVQDTPKPQLPVGQLAIIESVREVTEPGEAKGIGAVAGAVAGAVVGNQFGHGNGKKLVTILGAAGGALAGHHIEKHARGKKHWEIAVRLDDGSQRTLSSDVEPVWHAGDRVRLVNDRLQPV